MPTRGKKDPNGRALRGRRAHTTFISDPIAQLWSNYNIRSGVDGAITPEQPAVQNCLYDRFETIYKKTSIKPSLLIVPARLKAGTLFSQIPTNGSGDFTVVQASGNATRVNASGFVESAKTNLILRSEEFNDGYWSKSFGNVTQDQTTAPNGLTTADKYVVSNGQPPNSPIIRSFSFAINTTYTLSLFVKRADYDTASIRLNTTETGLISNFFNLASGTATNNQIQNYGNGWYRVWVSFTTAATVTNGQVQLIRDAQVRDGVAGIFIWGAQLETGSSPSEYIKTIASQRTRFSGVTVDGTVTANIPRLDYYTSNGTPGCPALLVEPSAQNLALQSENFATTWSPVQLLAFGSGSVLNTTATLDPYGTNVADLIVGNTVSGTQHRVDQTTVSVSGSYTFSVFLKTAGYDFGRLRIGSAGGTFNLVSGTISSSDVGIIASIQSYGNGWYRCIISKAASSANEIVRINMLPTATFADFAGDGTSGIYVFGAQYETGSVATSYIPTTTGPVTRNADVISVSGAVSGSIGQLSGTIYCEFAYFGQPVVRSGPIYLRQAASRGMGINFSPSDSPTGISFLSRNDGGSTVLTIVSGALQIGTFYKIAIGYDAAGTAAGGSQASGVVAYVNGVQTAIGTFRVPDAAGLKEFRMYGANSGTDAEAFNGRIRAAALYTTRLSNAELALITQP